MVTRFDSIWQNRVFLRQADMSIQAFSPGGFGEKDLWDPWQQTRWIRVVRTVQVYTRAQFIKRSRNTKRVIFARKCYSIIFCLFVCLFVCLSLLLLMLQTRFDDCNFQLKYLISIIIICIISTVTRNQSYGYPCHPQWEDDFDPSQGWPTPRTRRWCWSSSFRSRLEVFSLVQVEWLVLSTNLVI